MGSELGFGPLTFTVRDRLIVVARSGARVRSQSQGSSQAYDPFLRGSSVLLTRGVGRDSTRRRWWREPLRLAGFGELITGSGS